MLKVFAIGSCRIFRPLRRMHGAGEIELVNIDGPSWFLHCSTAARQFVESALLIRQIPPNLADLIIEGNPQSPRDGRSALARADLVAVEVSSLKNHIADGGWALNQHLLWHARNRADPRHSAYKYSLATPESVTEDLRTIAAMTGKPVATMDHLYYLGPDGTPMDGRDAITAALRYAERTLGFHLMCTRDLLDGRPQAETLEDSNHFLNSFEVTAGMWMLPQLSKAATPVHLSPCRCRSWPP